MWPEKRGGGYIIRDRVAGEKVTLASGYPNKTSAERAIVALTADRLRGDFIDPRGGRVVLADLVAAWWPSYARTLKPTAVHSEGGRVRNHIVPLLGRYTLAELEDSVLIQRWVDDLGAGVGPMGPPPRARSKPRQRVPLAPKTVHNCHGLLHTILNVAVARKLIRINPCAGRAIDLPARVHREMRFLTDPEIARLVAALPVHWRPLVTLLVATGLRWGEAVGLRAGRVDLLAGRPRLLVIEQLQEMSSTGELVFTSPKSERSRRTVSFSRTVALVLAVVVAGKSGDEMMFTTPTGLPIRARNFRRVWLAACKRAGLEGLRVHDLRHTHAAILIAANRPLSAISRRLGHSSIAVTDALYGHLREEIDDGILTAVDDALALVDLDAEVAAELEDEVEV